MATQLCQQKKCVTKTGHTCKDLESARKKIKTFSLYMER